MATFVGAVKRYLTGEAEQRRSIRSILLGPPGAGKGNSKLQFVLLIKLMLL